MSIQVTNLTKVYGAQRAIDGISFTLRPGEIVGFLGPNGAGKSTTMKILTGYLKASSGSAQVADFDVAEQPMPARRSIGYLPEHNPLYLDMYVREFLQFSGKLYGLSGDSLKSRVDEMVRMCGLESEKHKKIGQLSKGYRQRVGLAQSFLHDPSVLILDEPTTGLDPNQILEIRDLIRTAGKNKTVLFSTHIMQEVEALCDRVIIINKGKVVSDSSLQTLRESGKSLEDIFRSLTGA
ncbi:ATP-binding cassette domain-containing protein [Dyadobacter psychrotolerans]|uniref:ATP-binding cassette domain-containing protein n=1 Tax=Dyadobacter psychrotolerans TaxID=2541721 RepID=A0A4R5DEV9_9BACT|nr:ATP-binding cassette domain-containing protein [Dyadobacter psychrotolerans]TDE12319.1 ATP-binding cassette domain-containing protein [Dyadobacter psychrotolerans]